MGPEASVMQRPIVVRQIEMGWFFENKKNFAALHGHKGNETRVKGAVLEDHMLFMLSADPSEIKDVSADHPGEFKRMKELLQDQYGELLDNSHIWNREAKGQ